MDQVREEKICLTDVKKMGFTPKMIDELLPAPELKPNPRYSKAAPMKVWKLSVVKEVMGTPEYIAANAKRLKRSAASSKGVQTKTDKLLAEAKDQSEHVHVKAVDLETLRHNTLREKKDWYDEQNFLRERYNRNDVYTADEGTVKRWMVNYIRHHLTEYDDEFPELDGRTGRGKAYLYYFDTVMEKIAEAYPELKDECERQIRCKREPFGYLWIG